MKKATYTPFYLLLSFAILSTSGLYTAEPTPGEEKDIQDKTRNLQTEIKAAACTVITSLERLQAQNTEIARLKKNVDNYQILLGLKTTYLNTELANLYDQAVEHFKEALQIDLKALGKQHADTAKTYHYLGYMYSRQGKYDQAIVHYKEALAIRKEVLGEQHADTITSRNALSEAKKTKMWSVW